MNASPLGVLSSSVGLFYVLFVPIMVIQLFALLAIPCLLKSGARPADIGKAMLSYAAQTVGILLMTVGGIPTLYTVLASQPLSSGTYSALLFIFATGGLTYLWHDAALLRMDTAAKAIPQMVFACAWKFIGLLIILFALLSLMLRLTLQSASLTPGWWIMHVTLLLYGMILTYASFGPSHAGGFRTQTMGGMMGLKRRKK